jgi:hypothetical protein
MQSLTDTKDQEMRLADEMMTGASCVSCGIWHDAGYVRNRVFFGINESGWSCDMCIMEQPGCNPNASDLLLFLSKYGIEKCAWAFVKLPEICERTKITCVERNARNGLIRYIIAPRANSSRGLDI